MRFPALKPSAPPSVNDVRGPNAVPTTAKPDILAVTATAAGALLRAENSAAVLHAILTAAIDLGAPRPRAGLWRDEENAYAMWQMDANRTPVACGSAPASLYAAAVAPPNDPAVPAAQIPISAPGRRWGILDVGAQIEDGPSLAALGIIALQAALALERAAGGTVSHAGAGLLSAVEAWWNSTDSESLLARALTDVVRITGAESCSVTLLDTQPGTVRCLYSEDLSAEAPPTALPWKSSVDGRRNKDAVLRVMRTGQPVAFWWNPVSEALKAGIIPSGPQEGCYLAHPLSAAGAVFGVLDIYAKTPREFGPRQEEALGSAAHMLGRILGQHTVDVQNDESHRRQDIVSGLAMRLAALSSVSEVTSVVTDAARSLWPAADLIYIMLPQAEGGLWSIATLNSMRPENQRHGWARAGEGFAGWVIQSRQSLAVNSAHDDPRRGALDRGQDVKSGAWAPMKHGSALMGLLAVAFTDSTGELQPADVDLMERIAEQGAVALERVRDRHTTQTAFWDAIEAISGAIDARDGYTHGHSRNVTEYAVAIAQRLEMSAVEIQTLRAAALMHDIGKIGIPDHILNKPGSLTPDERTVMESHPEVGYEILMRAPSLQGLLPAVRFHHERPDGKGYPQGLSGDALPLMARIVAVADAFDAMASDRVYRKRLTVERAVGVLRDGAGTQWDESCVTAFLAIVEEHATPRLQLLTAEDSGRQYLPSIGGDVFGGM
ncbi:MAG TPA: HD domain-containing phosphohydrolase [Armatimonadota bacterium]|jgi:putative nucleotidyltransferase with HDIG domain